MSVLFDRSIFTAHYAVIPTVVRMDLLKPHVLRLVLVERNVVGGSGRATVMLDHSGTSIQSEPYCRPAANVKTIIPNNLKIGAHGNELDPI